mgnify:CR=1 FL=1
MLRASLCIISAHSLLHQVQDAFSRAHVQRDADGTPLVDRILDTAGQKGTGKWTSVVSLDLGTPLTLISEAVFARCLSAAKDERIAAARVLRGPTPAFHGDRQAFIDDLARALYASKVVSYTQGFVLLRAARERFQREKGKVIGKQGRTARSIRFLARCRAKERCTCAGARMPSPSPMARWSCCAGRWSNCATCAPNFAPPSARAQ